MRSSGASRELSRRHQSSSGHIGSPSKLKPAAVKTEATASTNQQPAESVSVSEAPPVAPVPASASELPPVPVLPAKPEQSISSSVQPNPILVQAPGADDAVKDRASAAAQTVQTMPHSMDPHRTASDVAAAVALPQAPLHDKPASSMDAAAAAAVAAVAHADAVHPFHERPPVEEPQPKRPKPFLFGRGLASRKSAAQAELTLPETATAAELATSKSGSDSQHAQGTPVAAEPVQDAGHTEHEQPSSAIAQFESPQQPAVHAAPPQQEADSPESPLPALADLLARNSPNSMVKSSYSHIAKDLKALQTHKSQLEATIKELTHEEQECSLRVSDAQAARANQIKAQQQRQQRQDKAVADEARITAQLQHTASKIADLQADADALPLAMSDVSQSEEDASISSQDEAETELDAGPVPMETPAGVNRQMQAAAGLENGNFVAHHKNMVLVQKLLAFEQAKKNLAYLLNNKESTLVTKQVGFPKPQPHKKFQPHWLKVNQYLTIALQR